MSESFPSTAFRAYDIRGVVPDHLNGRLALAIGYALAAEARERGYARFAVGRDGRLSSPELQRALMNGLLDGGADVIDVGLVPTPVLYYAAHELADGTGAMVTGSHNPPNYNGIKVMLGEESLAGDDIIGLYRRIRDNQSWERPGTLSQKDVADAYMERIVGDVRLARRLRIVADCGNGAASAIAPQLFRRLGCDVVELFCEVDGAFPNHAPDPSQPENLAALQTAVVASRADLGLAFDGDGDRLAAIDARGNIIWPDRLLMLFARDLLQRSPGATVMYDVKCTGKVRDAIVTAGGRALMCRTGHSPIKLGMRKTGALLAGELSGHMFFAERWYGFDDGLYAAARLLEILAAAGCSLEELMAGSGEGLATPELRLLTGEGDQEELMARLVERLECFSGAHVSTLDGVRVDYEDGWGLVRASHTTPSLVFRFEGETPDALTRIQDSFRRLLQEIEPQIKLPF